jgi:hypothetical protein
MAVGGQTDKTGDSRPTARKAKKKRAQEWGPFVDYMFVQTPTGEFAVPQGEVLSFGAVEVLNKETMQLEKKLVPEYRQASGAEIKKAYADNLSMLEALNEEDDE